MNDSFSRTVIVFHHDGLGQAEPSLRHRLVKSYLRTIIELGQLPKALLFYAGGVKLVAQGTPCLSELVELAAAGVPLIACRTCIEFYALQDQVVVGEIGNMLRIVEMQADASKVITL
ncbi:hypothetical protein ACFQNJ_02345 [Hydrogenophaga bisanensis]|uniref:Selenium metabolism protein YedF n=1 Tax=Hydrogenophaga bisanensis TaxID=439611 RepID=A0ABW2R6T6_9BURK